MEVERAEQIENKTINLQRKIFKNCKLFYFILYKQNPV